MVGVCYQLYIEEHEEDEEDNSLHQQAEVSWSQALILMADFNYPDIEPV